jgi:16S rRNA A1518/A1519 N6-dimethyltransferase RsmA/KsgA/DIM1 with predicted DNA glycosylase/AP lyase activity
LLEAAGIAGNLRAEDISVKDFARMALIYERSTLRRA